MTKKELEKEIDELREKLGELRYKVNDYDELKKGNKRLEKKFSRIEGVEDTRITMMAERIRELVLRNDILTMTPDQIESMRKIKVKGNLHDPLDLERHRDYERRLR